jgi:hypothetical protein
VFFPKLVAGTVDIILETSHGLLIVTNIKDPPPPKGCHFDVVGRSKTPHNPESDFGRSISIPPKPVRPRMREEAENNPKKRELRYKFR